MLTFGSNESLRAKFVSVGISEDNTSKGSATAAIMDNILYDATNVPIPLSVVERAQLRRVFVQACVGLKLWAIIQFRKSQNKGLRGGESIQWHAIASGHG